MEETKRSGMSKDQFWNLIEKAKEVCGTDLDASAVWIKQQLFYMTPEDVLQFHNLVYSYRDAAYKYGLWTAAGIMMEAMVVYPKLCECHLSEQVRKAPQKVRTWNVSRTDIRRMMARGNAAIKKMQEQGQNTPEATRPVRKGTVR